MEFEVEIMLVTGKWQLLSSFSNYPGALTAASSGVNRSMVATRVRQTTTKRVLALMFAPDTQISLEGVL